MPLTTKPKKPAPPDPAPEPDIEALKAERQKLIDEINAKQRLIGAINKRLEGIKVQRDDDLLARIGRIASERFGKAAWRDILATARADQPDV
jgi:hypothetical protein